jgi:hypothetical protein
MQATRQQPPIFKVLKETLYVNSIPAKMPFTKDQVKSSLDIQRLEEFNTKGLEDR